MEFPLRVCLTGVFRVSGYTLHLWGPSVNPSELVGLFFPSPTHKDLKKHPRPMACINIGVSENNALRRDPEHPNPVRIRKRSKLI